MSTSNALMPSNPPSSNLPRPKESILQIHAYVAGKSSAGAGKKIIKLSSNETPHGPSPKAIAAYQEAAAKLHRYPDGSAAELRSAIGEVYGIDPARIVCGCGSDELIGLLVNAYTTPGDEVLYSQHGFLMYKIYAQSFGALPVTAPEKNLTTDVDALLGAVTPRTKIVFVANPNNPTGSYISASELKRLREGLPSHILLAVDAAYAEYVEAKDYSNGRELVDATQNTVMLRTFSKIYGLSAIRLGWAYCPEAIADILNRVRSPFNVNTPAQMAGIAAVRDVEFTKAAVTFNTKWLAKLTQDITALGLRVWPSVGNFLLVEFPATGKTASAANAHLMAQGIIPREVAGYGLPNCLRITIGLEEENQALMAALKGFMQK